jgi:hypothetical protein
VDEIRTASGHRENRLDPEIAQLLPKLPLRDRGR